ncbi:MAG: hypothetical protein K2P78_03345 [Gemmataceae bacterium]|nr:hypothetical protein [Gemmataceae bacterium]
MDTLFLVCAVAGGALMLLQLLAGLVGFGGDHDTDHDTSADHGSDHAHEQAGNWFLGLLSVRTVTAALTFFGLGGMVALRSGVEELPALGVAVGCGVGALFLVAQLMKSLTRLRADGTARVSRAVGQTGTVYLRIPGSKTGPGKVHLSVQNRTVEYQAVTAGAELPTGSPVRVVGVVGPDTVEVVAA